MTYDPNSKPARQDAAALIQRGVAHDEIADITGLTPNQVARVARALRAEVAVAAGAPPAQVAAQEGVTMRTLQFDRALLRVSSWSAQKRRMIEQRRAAVAERQARGESPAEIAEALGASVRTIQHDLQSTTPPIA